MPTSLLISLSLYTRDVALKDPNEHGAPACSSQKEVQA